MSHKIIKQFFSFIIINRIVKTMISALNHEVLCAPRVRQQFTSNPTLVAKTQRFWRPFVDDLHNCCLGDAITLWIHSTPFFRGSHPPTPLRWRCFFSGRYNQSECQSLILLLARGDRTVLYQDVYPGRLYVLVSDSLPICLHMWDCSDWISSPIISFP